MFSAVEPLSLQSRPFAVKELASRDLSPALPAARESGSASGGPTRRGLLIRNLLVGGLLLLSANGCVQRRLLIRSQPEGAMVSIDRQAIGLTPVSVPFSYYGTREIQLEKDGYQTIAVRQRIRPPWYEWFPLSFFSNHFALREIRDVRRLDFEMLPKVQVSEYQLIERANQLRTDVGRGTVTAPVAK